MRLGVLSLLLCAGFGIHWLAQAQAAPPTDVILAKVRANITALAETLPDFVVEESLRITETRGDKLLHETRSLSDMTCVKKKAGARGIDWIESREVRVLNDKPVKKDARLDGAGMLGGGFFNGLTSTFAIRNDVFHVFSVSGFEPVDEVQAIVLNIATKDGQTGMQFGLNNKFYPARITGRALIDPQSAQVVRFALKYGNLPKQVEVEVAEDFSGTVIDGREYWLPRTVTSTSVGRGRVFTYTAKYTKYRKFGASTAIRYE